MSIKTSKPPVFAVSSEKRKEKESERFDKYYAKHQLIVKQEKELSNLHDLTYEEIDYSPQLVVKTWTEPPLPDLSYLFVENRLKIQDQYYNRIVMHILTIILIFLSGVIFYHVYFLPIVVGCLIGTIYSLHSTLLKRATALEISIRNTKAFIESKLHSLQEENASARYQFEKNEEIRIKQISDILEGEIAATVSRMEDVLCNLKFPFPVDMQVSYLENQAIINVMLPPKTIIPDTISEVITGREVAFHEKPFSTINKQYAEVCASLGVQICLAIFANLPKLESVCVNGIAKERLEDECWYNLIITREDLVKIDKCKNGLHVFNTLETAFALNNVFEFQPQSAMHTAWNGKVDETAIRQLSIRCL